MNTRELYDETVSELVEMGDEVKKVAQEFYNLLNLDKMSNKEIAHECAKIEVENFYH